MPLNRNTTIFALDSQAGYACRHSGECCTSGWPIPVECDTHVRLVALVEAEELMLPSTGLRSCAASKGPRDLRTSDSGPRTSDSGLRTLFIHPPDAPPETPALAAVGHDGACAFYEADRRRCAIHRQAGEALLPAACRQFPRVSLLDGRGLFVSLSHYCPTVAASLFDEPEGPRRSQADVAIVEAPAAFPASFDYDPLDAREALPPLVNPSVLFDLDAYDRWERAVVATLGRRDLTPEAAVATVARLAEEIRTWRPGGVSLGDYVARVNAMVREEAYPGGSPWRSADAAPRNGLRRAGGLAREMVPRARAEYAEARSAIDAYRLVADCVPDEYRPAPPGEGTAEADARWVADAWPAFAAPVRRYLAARAFGTWLAYQGRGVRTMAFSLEVALSILRLHCAMACQAASGPIDRPRFIDAVRRTDELLLHLASRDALARALSRVEGA